MLWLFIIGIVIAVAAAIAAVVLGQVERRSAIVALLIGLFLAYSSTWTTVDARSVAIKTSLSKYSGTLEAGFSHKAPWEDTEEWTTRNQVVRFERNGKDENEDDNFHTYGCIVVRLGNQSDACIDATITFAVTKGSVKGLWEQHKTFDAAIREAVVPQAKTAVDFVFGGWNPVAGIDKGLAGIETRTNEDWSQLLRPKVAQMYEVKSLKLVDAQVTFTHLDDKTRDQLNQISSQMAATQVAKEKIKTAEAEAAASAARKAQAGNTCIDLYRDLAAADQLKNVNAGFNCGQPSGALVGASPR